MYAATETVGRYGNVFAYVDRSDCYVATILADGAALWVKQSPSNGSVQIYRGDASALEFPKYGARRKTTFENIALTPGELLMAPEDNQYLSSGAVASKDGSVIAFGVTTSEPDSGHALVDGTKIALQKYHQFFALAVERYGEYGIFTYRSGTPGNEEYRERDFLTDIVKCELVGTAYTSPSTVQTLDPGGVAPPTTYSVVTILPDAVRYFDHGNSAIAISEAAYPEHVISGVTVEDYDPGTETYRWFYTTSGNGLVKFSGTRSESSSAVISLQCTGSNTVASVVAEDTFSYEHTVSGSRSANGFGYASGTIDKAPIPGGIPIAPYFSTSTVSAETTIHATAGRTIALEPGGDLLVTSLAEYEEIASSSVLDESTADGNEETNYLLHDSNLSYTYTLHKEERALMVFDPALDLLCYTEVVSDVISTGNHRNRWKTIYTASDSSEATDREIFTTSGGVSLPDPPIPKLVIKCHGATVEIALPFYTSSDMAFEPNKVRRLMELYANTGIAPGTPAISEYEALEPAQLFRTEEGFARADAILISDAAGATPGQRASWTFSRFRGLSPAIDHPRPSVTFTKTPETGGGFLTVTLDDGATIRKRYLIDSAGIRDADTAVAASASNNKGVPF